MPQSKVAIWEHFYGLSASEALGYAVGIAKIAVALCLLLGVFRTIACGVAAALHAMSVVVS